LILAVDIYDRMGLANPPSLLFCQTWVWIEGYITVASFMSMHALVAMRVNALHGGKKSIKILLWVAWILYAIPTASLLAVGLAQSQDTLGIAPFFNICYEQISGVLWTVWLPSLAFESLIFVLTVSKAIEEARRHVFSPISSILYRDGILYFLAIAVSSIFCMFVWLLGTPYYEGLAKYWATAIVNVAGCRLVISLKTNARALRMVRARTNLGQSSSFVVGNEYTMDPGYYESDYMGEYIDLSEISSSQLGTVYPPYPVTHWDAITI